MNKEKYRGGKKDMIKKSKLNKNEIIQKNNKSHNTTVEVAYYATSNAITLIALVITIIILLILAGVTIILTMKKDGILNIAEQSTQEHTKQEASEAMNLKITNIQMQSYGENKKLPNLQYLADKLCEDDEMEYVIKKEKEVASLEKIDVSDVESIFTKIKKYPYEFEIDSSLRLASIDGVKVVDNINKDLELRLEKLEQKSIMTAGLSKKQITTSISEEKINLDKVFASVGDGFELVDGEIKIRKDISYVKITAQVNMSQGFNEYVIPVLELYLNNEIVSGMPNHGSGDWDNVTISNVLLEVKKGDSIKMTFRNTNPGGELEGHERSRLTYMTIEEVK